MKREIIKIFFLSAIVLLSSAICSWAEDVSEPEGLSVSAGAGVFSKYIWRGYELNHKSIVIQPSVTLSYKGFSINEWANVDASPDAGRKWNETDTTLSYETSLGHLSLGAGYIYYNIKGSDDTQEVYLSAGYDTFLSPRLTVYKDIDSVPGYYFNLGLSHSIKLREDISLDLSGGLGYYISRTEKIVEAETDKKYKGPQDGLLSAGLTFSLNKQMTLSPSVSYSFPLSNKAKELLGTSGNAFGGLVFTFSF
jgi:uncharacterized protein (TIGR02001 family)